MKIEGLHLTSTQSVEKWLPVIILWQSKFASTPATCMGIWFDYGKPWLRKFTLTVHDHDSCKRLGLLDEAEENIHILILHSTTKYNTFLTVKTAMDVGPSSQSHNNSVWYEFLYGNPCFIIGRTIGWSVCDFLRKCIRGIEKLYCWNNSLLITWTKNINAK